MSGNSESKGSVSFKDIQQVLVSGSTKTQDLLRHSRLLLKRIEVVDSPKYGEFLKLFMNVFINILAKRTTPQVTKNEENELRVVTLCILKRLPINSTIKPYVAAICELASTIMDTDNEDNALICLSITFDLHKKFRHSVAHAKRLVAFISNCFSAMASKKQLKSFFPTKKNVNRQVLAARSFKILKECPFTVMLLMRIYPPLAKDSLDELVPAMIKALEMPRPQEASRNAKCGTIYEYMVICQTKTLSFLTHLLKDSPDALSSYEASIANALIYLLEVCPSAMVNIRREILTSMKHFLSTKYCNSLATHLIKFFDSPTLLGIDPEKKGAVPSLWAGVAGERNSKDDIRPLAYKVLADLTLHCQQHLNMRQIFKIFYFFANAINVTDLPTSTQIMASKVLILLVKPIYTIWERNSRASSTELPDAMIQKHIQCRCALLLIMDTFVERLSCCAENGFDGFKLAIASGAKFSELKSLTVSMFRGLCTIITELKATERTHMRFVALAASISQQHVQALHKSSSHVSMIKKRMLTSIVWQGTTVLGALGQLSDDDAYAADIGTQFATVFVAMSPGELEIAMRGSHMPKPHCMGNFASIYLIFDSISKSKAIVHWLRYLLEHRITSGVLLKYLLGHLLAPDVLPLLDEEVELAKGPLTRRGLKILVQDVERLMSIYKYMFQSIKEHPQNEVEIMPYLARTILAVLKLLRKKVRPLKLLRFLMMLFGCVKHSKSGLFYCSMLQILPYLVDSLVEYASSVKLQEAREQACEACLCIPMQLTTLLPYIHKIRYPLRNALESQNLGLIILALKTLDLWVEQLRVEFIGPLLLGMPDGINIVPLLHELLKSLDDMPNISEKERKYLPNIAALNLRLLGKLGGLNRRSFTPNADGLHLSWQAPARNEKSSLEREYLVADFPNNVQARNLRLPLEPLVTTAVQHLERNFVAEAKMEGAKPRKKHPSNFEDHYNLSASKMAGSVSMGENAEIAKDNFRAISKVRAYEFLKSYMAMHVHDCEEESEELISNGSAKKRRRKVASAESLQLRAGSSPSCFVTALKGIILASADEDLREHGSMDYCNGCFHYLASLFEAPVLTAIEHCLASEKSRVASQGKHCLKLLLKARGELESEKFWTCLVSYLYTSWLGSNMKEYGGFLLLLQFLCQECPLTWLTREQVGIKLMKFLLTLATQPRQDGVNDVSTACLLTILKKWFDVRQPIGLSPGTVISVVRVLLSEIMSPLPNLLNANSFQKLM
eukprot:g3765.t1